MRIHVLALLVAITAIPAKADPLNPPSLSVNLVSGTQSYQINSIFYYDSGASFDGAGVSYNFLNTSALGVDPELTSSINEVNGPNQSVSSSALITYQFEINGPGPTVPVTIGAVGGVMNYSGATFTTPNHLAASAILDVTPAGGAPVLSKSASLLGPSSFNIDPTLDLAINTVYTVDMSTAVSLFTVYSYSGTGPPIYVTASVDPTITLDTTNPAYSLEFSPGLVPSATPEPSSLILLGTGLAGAFAVARRRARLA